MTTTGDIVVNEDAGNKLAKLDKKQVDENEKIFDTMVVQSPNYKPTNAEAIVAIAKNDDGSIKWTFDNIYQNKNLASVAKDYYGTKNNRDYTDREAIDKFISDRTWKQSNTFSIGKEYKYITGNAGADQKARLAYLTREWNRLPNFYEEGGRGFEGLYKNLGVALLDPLNIIGGGIGGFVGKGVVKKAAGEAIKKSTQKQVGKEVAKDIITDPETLASLSSKIKTKQILTTSTTVGAVDAVGFAAADIAAQTTEKEIGIREKLDPKRTALVSIGAFGTSFISTGLISGGTRLLRNKIAKEETTNIKPLIEKGEELTDEALTSKLGVKNTLARNIADQYDFVKILQKNLTGVEGSAAGLKKAVESGKFKVDPVLMPYFQLRMAAAASTRSNDFILNGFYMPPSRLSGEASFIKGRSKGLNELLKPFDDVAETNSFLLYVMAKRQAGLIAKNPKLVKLRKDGLYKVEVEKSVTKKEADNIFKNIEKAEDAYIDTLPLTKQEMTKVLDWGEMSPTAYKAKYKENLKRKADISVYKQGLQDMKVFTDEALEYQVLSGLLSREAKDKILTANPYFIPFTRKNPGFVKKLISGVGEQTQKLIRTARPGAKRLAKTKQEGEINLYDNLVDYVYKAVNASDRNRAKLALYDMIAQGKKLKQLDANAVVKKAQPLITYTKVIGQSVEKKYKDAGFQIFKPDNEQLPNLDVATFSGTFKQVVGDVDTTFDVVYRNGKGEVFEIVSPELKEAYVAFGSRTPTMIETNWLTGAANWLSRISSRAITYSPPFVAFNIIRDTLAGTVNSVFGIVNKNGVGFVPGWSTAKGLYTSYRHNDTYRKALVNGLGYSSRTDSEKIVTQSIDDVLKYGKGPETKAYVSSLKKITDMAIGKPVWKKYAEFVSRIEYATRLGEFKLAKAAGLSDVAASFLGREVATDFGMKGSHRVLNFLSRNTMFLNAGLQGLYRTGRLFFEGGVKDRARVVATIGATIVAPEIYLYYTNRDIRQYKELDERIKQLNYCIPTFKDDGAFDGFIFIPKPYDLGVFANTAVALLKGVEKNSVGIGVNYFLSSFSQILPGLPVPQLVRPAAELLLDRNFYMGTPLLSAYEKPLVDQLAVRPSTRKIAIELSNLLTNLRGINIDLTKKNQTITGTKEKDAPLGLNPIRMDYLIRAYATGLFGYVPEIINAALFEDETGKFKNIDPFNVKGKGLNIQKPKPDVDQVDILKRPWSIVTRRFQSSDVIKNSSFHKEWFRIAKRAKELGVLDVTDINASRKNNSTLISVFDRIQTNIDNNNPIVSDEAFIYSQVLGDTFNTVFKKMQEFRELRKTIELAPGMSAEDKRLRINQLYNLENIMLKEYLDGVAEADIDFVLEKTMFGIFTVPTYVGDAEEKKSTFKRSDFEE